MSQSFRFNPTDVSKLGDWVNNSIKKEKDAIRKKIMNVTNVVYRTARAKRPLISKEEMKKSGRIKRVSDPNASYGVPVDTTTLQSSITMKIEDNGSKMKGTVYVDPNHTNPKTGDNVMKYAAAMEYGTSRIAARPFLRSSLAVNKDYIRSQLRGK